LQPYDIVALVPIIEAAGGIVTDWDGSRPEKGGNIIAAATPELHQVAMAQIIMSQPVLPGHWITGC
jgi:fructose-1,6-bisphosphatase/inositol monophosphatase family enzyme